MIVFHFLQKKHLIVAGFTKFFSDFMSQIIKVSRRLSSAKSLVFHPPEFLGLLTLY
jgi:hypothetical protein